MCLKCLLTSKFQCQTFIMYSLYSAIVNSWLSLTPCIIYCYTSLIWDSWLPNTSDIIPADLGETRSIATSNLDDPNFQILKQSKTCRLFHLKKKYYHMYKNVTVNYNTYPTYNLFKTYKSNDIRILQRYKDYELQHDYRAVTWRRMMVNRRFSQGFARSSLF